MEFSEPKIAVHVEHWRNWIGWWGTCPECDYDWWDTWETLTPEWQMVENDTGKEQSTFMGLKFVGLIEVECPKCFKWGWAHMPEDIYDLVAKRGERRQKNALARANASIQGYMPDGTPIHEGD